MPRPATGQVVERTSKVGVVTFALRFRAYGEREYVTLGTKEAGWTKAKAEAELRHVLADVERGLWQPSKPEPVEAAEAEQTFLEFSSQWFADHELNWKETTKADYLWALELHLLPVFGDKPLSAISVEDVDRYASAKRREGKLSNNSINKTLSLLSTVLDLAVDWDRIPRNPAKGKKRRLPAERRSRSWVEPEQLMALLDACHPTFRPLVATLAGGGLRIGEAIALTWADVNLASGSIRVVDAKTAAGIRSVDMPLGLASELRSLKARSSKAAAADPVFRNRDGDPQTVRNAQARMKASIHRANRALAKTGIDPISESATPHSLRRTFASLRFGAGDDPVYVAEQLGHTEAGFSMSVYAKALRRRERLSGEHLKAFDAATEWALSGTNAPTPEPVEPGIGLLERSEP